MTTESVEVRYEFAPADNEGLAFGLTVSQIAVICPIMLVVIAGAMAGVPLWLLVPLAVPVLGLGAARWRGDPMTTLAMRWGGWLLRPRRSAHKPLLAEATAPGAGGGDGEGEVRLVEVTPPGWARRLELLQVPWEGATVGVWRDGDALATVLKVIPPATALRDLDEQQHLLANWGDLLSSVGVEGSPVQRIAWVARTSPDQGATAAAWLRDKADQTVRLEQSSLWQSYVQVGEAAGGSAAERELLLVVRIQPDRARRRLRGARSKEERELRAAEMAIQETARVAGRLVELGCQVEGVFTPEAVASVVRTTFDPTARDDLAWWRAAGGDGTGGAGVSPLSGMWPLSREEAADHVRTDGGYHRVGWIEEWPTVPVTATWLHPLLLRSGWTRTVTMVMEPVATQSAVRATHRARASAASEADVRARHGFISNLRADRGLAAAEQREQELIDGHRDMRFGAYVTVSARTLAELEDAWLNTIYEAGQAKCKLRALHGQHEPAMQVALPLGRFL